MTVDEIFTSESEHLYFRLIAARNALNAANDSDTIQVLNDILDETLNNIDRIGTDEEIAAAEVPIVGNFGFPGILASVQLYESVESAELRECDVGLDDEDDGGIGDVVEELPFVIEADAHHRAG